MIERSLETKNTRPPKTFVFGDCHGAYRALKQIFDRAPIAPGDTIISIGDIADGWSETYECVELLLEMQKTYNMIFIKGNHDDWTLTMMKTGAHPGLPQGGRATLDSYLKHCPLQTEPDYINSIGLYYPETHLKFFEYQHLYYKDDKNRIFVHGGFNRHHTLAENKRESSVFYWDRDLWHTALSYEAMRKGLVIHDEEGNKQNFKIKEPCTEIFIGHTTTGLWGKDTPMSAGPVWNLDTGAGFEGKLTIMDVDTHEYYQSDRVMDLYPDEFGRRKGH